ncbi:MAG: HEPN domain-containing protein [Vulcanimicrobiota bacterium]
MDERILELSTYRMEKARNDLETSEILFDNGRFAQSVNRSYYAMFHAARALMAFERYDS